MADIGETKKAPDYLARAAGSFGLMGGMTPDIARRMVLDRVGVPQGDPLRAGIADTHPSDIGPETDVLPDPFPPADYAGKLETGQDYLNLIAATPPQKTSGEIADGVTLPPLVVAAPPVQPIPDALVQDAPAEDAPKEQE